MLRCERKLNADIGIFSPLTMYGNKRRRLLQSQLYFQWFYLIKEEKTVSKQSWKENTA